jgi:tmRNA-binding protein
MKRQQLPDLSSKPWKDFFFKKLRSAKPSEVFDFDALDLYLNRECARIKKRIAQSKQQHHRRQRIE